MLTVRELSCLITIKLFLGRTTCVIAGLIEHHLVDVGFIRFIRVAYSASFSVNL